MILCYVYRQEPSITVLWEALSTQQLTDTDAETHSQTLDRTRRLFKSSLISLQILPSRTFQSFISEPDTSDNCADCPAYTCPQLFPSLSGFFFLRITVVHTHTHTHTHTPLISQKMRFSLSEHLFTIYKAGISLSTQQMTKAKPY